MLTAIANPARRRTPTELAKDEGLCVASIYRFMTRGTRCPDGGVIRLRATRLGGRWFVTDQAWADYVAALNPPHPNDAPVAAGRRVDPRVDAELDRLLGPV